MNKQGSNEVWGLEFSELLFFLGGAAPSTGNGSSSVSSSSTYVSSSTSKSGSSKGTECRCKWAPRICIHFSFRSTNVAERRLSFEHCNVTTSCSSAPRLMVADTSHPNSVPVERSSISAETTGTQHVNNEYEIANFTKNAFVYRK